MIILDCWVILISETFYILEGLSTYFLSFSSLSFIYAMFYCMVFLLKLMGFFKISIGPVNFILLAGMGLYDMLVWS